MILRMKTEPDPTAALVTVKVVHTVVWVFFVSCILAVPVSAGLHHFNASAAFAGLVLLECLVLAVNRCRCPLTDLAARFAPERFAEFRYLPSEAGGPIQQADFWNALRPGRSVCNCGVAADGTMNANGGALVLKYT
jgi:hypothetical protein